MFGAGLRVRRALAGAPFALLLAASPVAAAPEFDASEPRWEGGLGFGFNPAGGALIGDGFGPSAYQILVPLQFGAHFMLEPSLGFSSGRSRSDGEQRILETSATSWGVALGAAYVWALDQRTLGHVGVRGGRQHFKSKLTDTQGTQSSEAETTSYSVGPFVGGELFASPSISLGIELALAYTHSTRSQTGEGLLIVPVEDWSIRSDGFLLFRVYFWRFDSKRS